MPTSIPTVIDVDPDAPSGIAALAAAALHQEKTIPEGTLRRIPEETAPVSNLLAANLPQRFQGVLRSPESCVSKQTPDWTTERLWETRVPARGWLGDLDIALDRGWASGASSIEVPTGSKGLRFPL